MAAAVTTSDEWLVRIRGTMARGEYLVAFDEAVEATRAYSDDVSLQYQMVLALARAGASDQALEALESSGLEPRAAGAAVGLQEDVATLRARLAKDRALTVGGKERRAGARRAAELYELIYERFHRPYSCINAATMWLVAGDDTRAATLARAARALWEQADVDGSADAYWQAATDAEAALHLDDYDAAGEALERAAGEAGGDLAAVATTRKQLLLVCEIRGIDPTVLTALAVPTVIHYGGHMVAPPGQPGGFPAEAEGRVSDAIRDHLESQRVGVGFGSLACGADILFAEALLARGAELRVLLPFAEEEFKRVSVARGGARWTARFDRCLRKATSVTWATDGEYLGDDSLFEYCARLAMGHALIRATFLTASVEQVVVWDGQRAAGDAGTAADVEAWRATGCRTHVIAVEGGDEPTTVGTDGSRAPSSARVLRAMLFADVKGFSTLPDSRMAAFLDNVMAPLAVTLEGFDDHILYRNTWGDGLYVVLDDVSAAAQCALALQDTMKSLRPGRVGLPEHLGLRIGAHAGPVFEAEDPVRREPNFYGVEVTRTARIQPRTPEGDVYVTDPFAALVALEAAHDLSCQYVGHIPTAKDYGTFPMYVLKRRA
ncbi:MAG: TRAFs-binding domain-containing protein [Acidimicrobiia bacterium]